MVAWFVVSIVLLSWNAIYCASKVIGDFRGATPASGVWGLFALAGAVSALGIAVTAILVSVSGI